MKYSKSALSVLAACGAVLASGTAYGQSVEEFYHGKQMTLIISTGVGGGYDLNGRTIARHLPKHLPGHPTIVAKNMPGAGHVRAANFLATQAPRDGSHIGTLAQSFVLHQVMDGRGVQYDAAKFIWLGSSEVSNSTIYVWSTHGIKTLDDARKQEVLLGATGVGSGTTLYPAAINNILGTKFRIVPGYKSGGEINLAMERGEVHGRAGNNFNSIAATNPDWLSEKKINFLAQIGLKPEKGYEQVPMMTELASNDKERRIMRLFAAPVAIGRPLLTTADVPTDRVNALRAAFDATMKDPEFLADAKKAKLDIAPMSGVELQEIVEDIVKTPADIIAAAKATAEDKDILKESVASGKDSKEKGSKSED